MKITQLNSSFNGQVEKIFHMADIHIRLTTDRYNEYKQVFKKVYKICSSDDSIEKSIILLCGDILHSKNELSPECVELTINFLKSLANIADVIVIMGNHDGNLSNKSRLDSLTPLIKEINSKHNIHYLLNSGIYRYNNIYFGVTSVYDQLEDSDECKVVMASKIPNDDNIKIALYHGPLHGSITDVGYRMNQDEFTIDDFNGYDYVLLGDIHRFQYLNSEKTICYPSSLIQQNYGETIKNHGLVVWDLINKESKFTHIPNDYGYCHINVKNGVVDYKPENIPKKPRIKLIVDDTSGIKVKEITEELRNNFDIQEITYTIANKNLKSNNKPDNQPENEIHKNLQNVKYQNKLIKEYIKTTNNIDIKLTNDIIALNTKLNKEIVNNINTTNKWKILTLEFSNMFCYGKDNEIDFSKLNGVIGLFAPNHSGKSSVVDIILFTLFDKCSRGMRSEIMNQKKKQFYSRMTIEVEGCQYIIMRVGKFPKKNSKNIKIDVSFWKKISDTDDNKGNISSSDDESDDELDNESDIEDKAKYITLNGNDRIETNKQITNLIGTYDDYVTTSFCLQQEVNFIDYTQGKKKDFLIKMLKLNIFEELLECAKLENKSKSILLKDLTGKIKNVNVLELRNKLTDYESAKNKGTESLGELNTLLNKYHTKIEQLSRKIIVLDESSTNTEQILKEKKRIEKIVKNLEGNIKKITDDVKGTKENISSHYNKYTPEMVRYIEETQKTFEDNKQQKISNNSNKIKELFGLKRSVGEFDKTLEEYEKDLSIKKKKLTQMNTRLEELIERITKLHSLIVIISDESYNDIKTLYQNFCKIVSNIDNFESKKLTIQRNIKQMEDKLDKLSQHEYDPECKYCVNNIFVKDAIETKELLKVKKERIIDLQQKIDANIKKKNFKKYSKIEDRYNSMLSSQKNNITLDKELKENCYEKELLEKDISLVTNSITKISNKIKKFENQKDDIKYNAQLDRNIQELEENLKSVSISKNIEYQNYQHSKDEILKLERNVFENDNQIKSYQQKMDKYISDIKELDNKIIKLDEYSDQYEKNNKIVCEVSECKKLIDKCQKEITKINKDKDSLIEKICYTKKEIEMYELTKNEIKSIEKEANVYNSYVKIIKKDGLPYILLNDLIPQLEEGINNILLPITNFSISIRYDDGSINLYKVCKNSKLNLELCSGFEKFIVGFAVRISLINLSRLSSGNFMLIDEGFSCMDSKNIKNLTSLFGTIRNMFDFVIVISHLEYVKSLCDSCMAIDVNHAGYSHIYI